MVLACGSLCPSQEFLGVRLGNRFEVGYDSGSHFVDCLFLFTVGFVPSEKLS